MLNKDMAFLAQRYEVSQIVRFLISLYPKQTEGDFVMNIKFPSQLCSRCAAMLTGVIVALTRLAALRVPIWAVIGELSTLPQMIVWARFIGGQPETKALSIAKVTFAIERTRYESEFSTALSAMCGHAVVVRAILARRVSGFPFAPAGSAAEVAFDPVGMTRFTSKRLAALFALNFHTIVARAVYARVKPLVTGAGAWAATVISLVATELAQLARELLSTFRASQVATPDKFGRTPTSLARNAQAVTVMLCAMEVFECGRVIVAALWAMFKGRGIMGLHVESPFDVPSPRPLQRRWDNCFPRSIIPQMGGAA